MEKKYKTLKPYKTPYSNPITLVKGEIVRLGKEETEEKWRGWIWAENDSNKGWIPRQIVAFSEDKRSGCLLENYSAKELTINADEQIMILRSLNGWSWVQNITTHEEGWIPDEIIGQSE
ncbi:MULTISPECIES: SH3 domain-containing protein [Olivibacter]|jgi:hypothetical protein|uniref:Variant SH3 domain-containing protein n=2 Tax=Sphingobacteriaceae TaxID=84566 RepID=F4C0Y6_SPHS2|nr:SH3 domain-containing protein [Olivibacter sp. 47]MCL4640132.1 SH3 domain-containing protein [Olivibacter sp. UJ_SKK_5.1]MDM8174096.1 SH3 domain-containing protein [Olivibacter sp. 47]MDX3917213.1 SH3 domain-containing protein [Pseudosphingobacterium sp.]